LTPGQAGDNPQALPLLEGITPGWLAADRAYDSDELLDALAARQIGAVIPPRKNRSIQRPYDHHLYKSRNLVERFFCRIKQFRRIATRYDKLAERFASFIAMCAFVIYPSAQHPTARQTIRRAAPRGTTPSPGPAGPPSPPKGGEGTASGGASSEGSTCNRTAGHMDCHVAARLAFDVGVWHVVPPPPFFHPRKEAP
jgi:transposase